MRQQPAISRRLFHLATGLVLAFLVFLLGKEKGVLLVGSLFLLTVLAEALRLTLPAVNRWFIRLFGSLLKGCELSRPTGVGYFHAGVLICLLFFDLEVALASMVILSAGDPAAGIAGQRWGRTRIGKKSLEGAFGFVAGAMIAGIAFQVLWPGITLPVYTVGVLAGAIVESLPIKVDDNLILPVAAALAIQAAVGLI